ncbi:MAG: TM2 domain-containing protein [Actinomycetaceae bacterium]|nr:TM2 domain-containing protein [Actinomycetaceae bacterium]
MSENTFPSNQESASSQQTSNPSVNVNVNTQQASTLQANIKTINKHVFVWVFAWLLGGFGADRFVRGQIGLGLLKLFFGWLTLGIWALVDWIIAIIKAYSSTPGDQITFINGKYSS